MSARYRLWAVLRSSLPLHLPPASGCREPRCGKRCFFSPLLILFVTGMVDDLRDLSPGRKFFFQFIAAGIVCAGGLRIRSDFGLFGIGELDFVTSYIVTMLFITAMTNAYNLIDGVDGLLGGIALIGSAGLGLLFLQAGDGFHAALSFALSGALAGFLRYNFHPAILFMGDTGSPARRLPAGGAGDPVLSLLARAGACRHLPWLHRCCRFALPAGLRCGTGLHHPHAEGQIALPWRPSPPAPCAGENGLSAPLVCPHRVRRYRVVQRIIRYLVATVFHCIRFTLIVSLAVLLAEGLTIAYLVRSRKNLRSRADQFGDLRRKNRFAARLLNF